MVFRDVTARVRAGWPLAPMLGDFENVRQQRTAAVGADRCFLPRGVKFCNIGGTDVLQPAPTEQWQEVKTEVSLVFLDCAWLFVGPRLFFHVTPSKGRKGWRYMEEQARP